MAVEQVSEVGGGLVMEGFEGEKKNFKLDVLDNRAPVEVLENGLLRSWERERVRRSAPQLRCGGVCLGLWKISHIEWCCSCLFWW